MPSRKENLIIYSYFFLCEKETSVAVIYPSTKWILQIRVVFPGLITHTINSMCLILNFACWNAGTLVLIILDKKAGLLETKVNDTKDWKVRMVKISFDLRKNGCHKPSDLGSRSIVVVSEWVRQNSSSYDFLKIDNFISGSMFRLFK